MQGRAEHTAHGMGSGSTEREQSWAQSSSSWQGQLQAAEPWAGSGGKVQPRPGEGAFRQLSWCLALEVAAGHALLGKELTVSLEHLLCSSLPVCSACPAGLATCPQTGTALL